MSDLTAADGLLTFDGALQKIREFSQRSLDKRSAVRGFNISGASRRKIHDRWTALRLSNESRLRLLCLLQLMRATLAAGPGGKRRLMDVRRLTGIETNDIQTINITTIDKPRRRIMAFVNEKFPLSEKARIDELVASRPPLVRAPGLMSWWTVDRERDVFLVLIGKEGGMPEGTPEIQHYVLSWRGNLVHFAGDSKHNCNPKNGLMISWRIHRLNIPLSLNEKKEEVRQLICEALDALGWLYNRNRVESINVEFDLPSSK
jgi:hypothetical protein